MKIVYLTDCYMRYPEVGPVPDPFRQQVLEVLKRLGHDVTMLIVNRDYLQDRSIEPLVPDGRARLARDVAALKPDLVFTINRAGLCPEVLELDVPRFASWYIDNIHTFPPSLLQFAENEQVFFFGPRSALEPDGAPAGLPMSRRHYLPLAVDARSFKPRALIQGVTNRRFNILFMGSYFNPSSLWQIAQGKSPAFYQRFKQVFEAVPSISSYTEFEAKLLEVGFPETSEADRRRLLNGMLSAWSGLRRIRMLEAVQPLGLTIYGDRWDMMIPEHLELLTCFSGCSVNEPELIASLFGIAALTVNITHQQSRLCGGLNLRVFEALSTGTLLVNDHPEEVGAMFEEGATFLSYRDAAELREKCAWALENPVEAKRIAEAGRRAVLAEHTLQHRMAGMLRIMDEV